MPGPPPGAGVAFIAAPVFAVFAGAALAAAGAADAEVWGLKKSASVFFAGDADAAALAAGLAAASDLAFRVRLAFGEAAGDSAAEAVVAV